MKDPADDNSTMVDFEKSKLNDDVEQLWAEIDSMIESDLKFELVDNQDLNPTGLQEDLGFLEMQKTFLEIAKNTLNPVARYMKALTEMGYSKEILHLTEMVITGLIPQVEAVALKEHAEDLTFFRSLVYLALAESDQHAKAKIAEVVVEGFKGIEKRFQLKYRSYKLAVEHLVSFYKALHAHNAVSDTDIRRFFSIGVPSLTWVRRTKIEEMISLSGISLEVMKEIRKLSLMYHASKMSEAYLMPAMRAPKPEITLSDIFDDDPTLPPMDYNRLVKIHDGNA